MRKSFAMVALAVVATASFIGGCRTVVRQQPTDGKLLVFHMDFNIIQMNRATVSDLLRKAADNGYNAILWEIENKVQLDTIPPAIHPEAFTKDEFRAILAEADALGLEAIPLLQTFGHGEYVLNCKEYKHLREQHDKPDCYCVSKPEVRELHLRLVNEYLQLFGDRVKRFHLGGDEAYCFGSCPICKKRNRIELYVEHLEALVKPIRERGIRPGVWHDMLLDPQHAADRAKMPADYTIWYWDYGYGASKARTTAGDKKIESLRKEGREMILCGASQSSGEDPFFPRAKFHRDNLTALAEKARKTCAGFCVTSWSIRQSLKRFQYPLIDYAAQRYLAPSADAAEDWKAAVTRAFGAEVTPEMVDGLFSCDHYLNGVDGRQWTFFKEGIPPPPLYYRQWMKDYPAYIDNFADRAAKEKARVIKELAKWKAIKGGNELVALAVRAGEMKLVLCETIRAALKGEKYSPCPLDEVAALYSVDQSEISAANSARLVFGFYADVRQRPTDGKLLIFHMDFNIIQMNRATVSDLLRKAADNGYNAILWEIENKVQLDTIPPAIHPEAFTKDEFRAILAEADALGLEAIPLLQAFGHGEYVLNCKEYKHLREQHDKPDCYCVSKPEVRELHLRLVNEYLQLFGDRVKRFHLGSDEAYCFGSCPICKKRNRIELYVEHLEALVKPIRERGIRPGVWHDMILDPQHAADRAKMPADYTIWYGDYGYGVNKANTTAGDKKIESLRQEGREVILCGASQSAGEDPFFPRAKFHRDNLTALAEKARKTCAGFCVTSWSIRQSLKRFQYPLIDYAAQRYLAPSTDAAEDWKAAVTRAFGAEVTPEMVDGLFSCDLYLNGVDGRQWTFFKEGIPPPPLYYRQWMKDYPEYVDNFADRAAKEKARVIKELAKWKEIKGGNDLVALAVRAGEMKLVLCETIRAALKGEKYSPCPLDELAALYSVDQSEISAANSARLVFGFYAD